MDGGDDGAHAEAQLVDGAQIPLDAADGQPPLLPQGGDQADQVDPQALLPQGRPVQLRLGEAVAPAEGTNPGDEDVLGDLRGDPGQVDDLPGAMGPAAGQRGPAIGAALHRVLHPVGGGHPSTGKAMGPGLPGLLGGRRFRAGPGLEAGHPRWAARFGFVLQLGDAPFQAANDRLLLDDEGDELVAAGGVQVDAGIHVISMNDLTAPVSASP